MGREVFEFWIYQKNIKTRLNSTQKGISTDTTFFSVFVPFYVVRKKGSIMVYRFRMNFKISFVLLILLFLINELLFALSMKHRRRRSPMSIFILRRQMLERFLIKLVVFPLKVFRPVKKYCW